MIRYLQHIDDDEQYLHDAHSRSMLELKSAYLDRSILSNYDVLVPHVLRSTIHPDLAPLSVEASPFDVGGVFSSSLGLKRPSFTSSTALARNVFSSHDVLVSLDLSDLPSEEELVANGLLLSH